MFNVKYLDDKNYKEKNWFFLNGSSKLEDIIKILIYVKIDYLLFTLVLKRVVCNSSISLADMYNLLFSF
jgi:hypothetical protein